MLRSLSHGTIVAALTLMWMAAAWVVCDLLFADPALLVFEEIAILCAVEVGATVVAVVHLGWR